MLENLYTTKMSTNKETLKARLEAIQREPKKRHRVIGLLALLAVLALLACATACLARTTAVDTTMTNEEFAAYLAQPLGADMATLDYADQEILVFHYGEALFVLDLGNYSFRHILDLRELDLTTATQGDVFLQVDVAQDGSQAYLSVGGQMDLAESYSSYIVDLTTGQAEEGKIPEDAEIFNGYGDTAAAIPGVTGWYSWRCITVGEETYYLTTHSGYVNKLELVTSYANGRPNRVWYLFGEDSTLSHADPSDLYTTAEQYLATEFYRAFSPFFAITELSISDWEQNGNEATFQYTMTYIEYDLLDSSGVLQEGDHRPQQMRFPMKVSLDQNRLTFYQDTSGWGGAESDRPEWSPMDIQALTLIP